MIALLHKAKAMNNDCAASLTQTQAYLCISMHRKLQRKMWYG